VDGVTTNPSLMAKESGDWRVQAGEICALVPGPVSLEVIALDAEGMIREARELMEFGPNVVVKIPMTFEGMKAVRALKSMHIDTNVTLVFSATQALLAAKAGATYVSPFVGRLDDIGHDGMELVRRILTVYENYDLDTQVITASVRSPKHVLDAALSGAHIATVPFKILTQLAAHPLTDKGIAAFLEDWKKKG
jgi:transaldolase